MTTDTNETGASVEVTRDRKPILCLDFDGVIHSYKSGWQGADVVPDPPTEGAIDFIREAVDAFRVAIFSSRTNQPMGVEAMQFWLRSQFYKVEEREVADPILDQIEWPREKPPALITIDDRALTFSGNWNDYPIAKLLDFKPWNKCIASTTQPRNELTGVIRLREDEPDAGFWHSCSGCQESSEGVVSEHYYPYSDVFKCQPGSGCTECGGLGVLWDDVDYTNYGDELTTHPADAARVEALEAALRRLLDATEVVKTWPADDATKAFDRALMEREHAEDAARAALKGTPQ